MYGAVSDESGGTGAHAIGRSERGADAFARAARHSRRVRALKVVLPVAAVLIAGLFFGYSLLASRGGGAASLDSASIEGGDLVMHNPSLDGFTNGDLPYHMTADRARQAIGAADGAIALEGIEASLPIDAENRARISAGSGSFDRQADRVTLSGAVTVTTTTGIVARLQSANVDMASRNLSTNDPVEIEMEGMRVRADSFRATEGGRKLVFENRVRVELDPALVRKQERAEQ